MLQTGMTAPDINLPDQDGNQLTMADLQGKWRVVYFYPKDDTPGCTAEACSFRDTWEKFSQQKIEVIGISADSVASHKKFQEKYTLPFTLLSDPDKQVIKQYGAWGEKLLFGKKVSGIIRMTYIINPQGKIVKVYAKVSPSTHGEEILKTIAELSV